jgi:hypothetical protein
MAVADAWLWLEGGDPPEVARWLSAWYGKEALGAVTWLAVHPGRLVDRERIRAEVTEAMAGPGGVWAWNGWARGPMPS